MWRPDSPARVSTTTRADPSVTVGSAPLIRIAPEVYVQGMSVPVLVFASYADAFGARTVTVPVAVPCTVADVVAAMRTLPGGDRLPSRPVVAVNQSYAGPDVAVQVGDEVAMIPPVAGG